MRWYIVKTYTGKEEELRETIEREVDEIAKAIVIRRTEKVMVGGRIKYVTKNAYPGIVMAYAAEGRYTADEIRSHEKVRWVRAARYDEVEALLA